MTQRLFGWRRTAPLFLALPLALLLYSAAGWWDTTAIVFPTSPRSGSIHLAATAARPVFTHAVIPGGAYSPEELRDAFQRDAVVAAHYRDVDPRDMRLTTLSKGKAAYVSYRVGDRIYWTRNRVWIKPGESVLTDGTVEIRARCGNCISDTRGEVAAVEPASGVLDESVIPPTDDSRVEAFAAEAEYGLGELLTIPFGPQALASFAPQVSGVTGDNPLPLWPQPTPFVIPPTGLPGSSGGGATGGVPGGPDDVPGGGSSTPPAPFVPGDGSTTGSATSNGSTGGSSGAVTTGSTGNTTSGSTSGGTTTGSPVTTTTTGTTSGTPTTGTTGGATTTGTGTSTTGASSSTTGTTSTTSTGSTSTGWPGDTTGGTTGPTTTGWPTTDTTTGIVTTTGSPTSGVSSTTNTGHEAPEPDLLWLVALGAVGLANRSWRRWR